jgi:ATP-dependent DNA helicase RecG
MECDGSAPLWLVAERRFCLSPYAVANCHAAGNRMRMVDGAAGPCQTMLAIQLRSPVTKEIGLADELGSGVRKLFKYCKTYSGRDPELIENDIFRFILPLSEENQVSSEKTSEKTPVETPVEGLVEGLVDGLVESQREIMSLVRDNPHVSIREMSEQIGISTTAVDKNLTALKGKGLLKRIGPDKGGHWEVLP